MASAITETKRALFAALVVVAAVSTFERTAPAWQPRLATASQAEAAPAGDPSTILAAARTIYIQSRTALVKSEVIESELQKRADFKQAGLLLTKEPRAADLVIEVRRSSFTTEYPYVAVDSKTRLIVASGKVNSLFGTAAGKIANGFMKQVAQARKIGAPARSK